MKRDERLLWGLAAAVAVLALALVVLAAVTAQELAEVDRELRALKSGDGLAGDLSPLPTLAPGAGLGDRPRVAIAGVEAVSGTVGLTVTVRAYGGGDLLYEPPVLTDETGRTYPVDGESLEAARMAFLDLVTRGQATARLVFVGRPPGDLDLWLSLNPGRPPDDLVAPPLQVPVPRQGGGR